MNMPPKMRNFAADERGMITVMAAVSFVVVMGMGALAIDLSHSWAIKSKMEATTDAASLAGAQQLPNTSAVTPKALDLAARNTPSNYGTLVTSSDVLIGNANATTKTFTANATPFNAVKVTASRTAAKGNAAPRFFAGVIGLNASDIVTESVAYRSALAPAYCVYVLSNSNTNTFSVGGGGKFEVPNCGVYINSGHPNSAGRTSGASTVAAKRFCIVGGYSGTFSPTPTTGCSEVADPLSSVPEPAMPAGGCKSAAQIASSSWTPGLYCGNIVPPANVTLASGLYYFSGATLDIGSGQNITGSGVTLFFSANSTLNHNSGGGISISAPTSGSLAGIALFHSRSTNTNHLMKLTGNTNFNINGTIYFPKSALQLAGMASLTVPKSGYVITWTMSYTGSSDFYVGTTGGLQAIQSWGPPHLF